MTMRVTYKDINKNTHIKVVNEKQYKFLIVSIVSIKGNIEKIEHIA